MTLYPSERRQQRATMVRDALVVASIALLAWLGRRVYLLVDDLRSVTDAVQGAGSSVQSGFGSAADVLSGTPLVGDELAGALEAAGATSGGNIVELALTGDTAIHRLALALGLLTFAVPAAIVVVLYLPVRVAQIRRLRAARLVYREAARPRATPSPGHAGSSVAADRRPRGVHPGPHRRPRPRRPRRIGDSAPG